MASCHSIILTLQNWDHWYKVIQSAAMADRVWEFMDPEVDEKDLPTLEWPKEPHFSMVKEGATSIFDLDPLQLQQFRYFDDRYRWEVRDIKKKEEKIRHMSYQILVSTTENLAAHLEASWSPHRMLQTLKRLAAPRPIEREINALRDYQRLMRIPESMDLKQWLLDLRAAFKTCEKLNLPEAQPKRAIANFLKTFEEQGSHILVQMVGETSDWHLHHL
ncbi:hypothetical protein VTN02DRAFT_5104 [Thermoascus thermophilus]